MIQIFDNLKHFSQLTGIGVCVIAHDGTAVYETDEAVSAQIVLSYLDDLVENTLQEQTRATMISGAMQSYRFGGRFFFFSPIGMFHFASPIITGGRHTLTAIGGPLLMSDTDEYIRLELAGKLANGFDHGDLAIRLEQIPHVSPDRANTLSEQLLINAKHLSDPDYLGQSDDSTASRYSDYVLAYFSGMPTYESILRLAEEQTQGKAMRKHETIVEAITKYAEENYAKKITLKEAAREVFISSSYLSKIIREKTGGGFRDLVNKARIAEAQRLLAQSDMSIGEIAYAVGFEDHSYFTKVFLHHTGLTPTGYRAMLG
jgi:AraC-like DNA-binding protein/ligand-binding sensor protein